MKLKVKNFVFISLVIVMIIIAGILYTKPQKVYLSGRLIGFELDENTSIFNEKSSTLPTSTMKVGTVTFIKKETNEFVALGHSTIEDNAESSTINGNCYNVNFEGIKKPSTEEAGNIIAALNKHEQIGYLYKDSNYGIFGRINDIDEKYEEVDTCPWYSVRKGKASMLMTLDDDKLKSYDVEIIGIDYLHDNRNLKIKIIDNELLEKAGGVVQGMSGTPIMQNRKTSRSSKLCKYRKSEYCIWNFHR